MAFFLFLDEKDVYGRGKFANRQGKTECVEFVQRATGAPLTAQWRRGQSVRASRPGDIPKGTAIATFDGSGRYPVDSQGKHAAVYLSHSPEGITVLDQWNSQGEVKKRLIRFAQPAGTSRSNNGDTFYVIA